MGGHFSRGVASHLITPWEIPSADTMAQELVLTLYHGTSVLLADTIEKEGLKSSTGGALGRGVYLADLEKASNFALGAPYRREKGSPPFTPPPIASREGSGHARLGEGAVVLKVVATVRKPKYIEGADPDGGWKREGYDSVCTRRLNPWSKNPEWCIADPVQCQIVGKAIIYYGNTTLTEASFVPVIQGSRSEKQNPTCPGRSNWGHRHPAEDGERVQCGRCGEYRCSNCIPVHMVHCPGRSVVKR